MKSYFPRLLNKILVLKEKHRNERKRTSKLASCHRALVWSPFAFLRGIHQQALIKTGYVFKQCPVSKGWVFPTVPLQSLPVSQEAPRQRPDSFRWLTQPQKEKCNTYLRDYLESRVSWKRELCPPHRDETCDTQRRFDAATLAWGAGEFSMLQIFDDAVYLDGLNGATRLLRPNNQECFGEL